MLYEYVIQSFPFWLWWRTVRKHVHGLKWTTSLCKGSWILGRNCMNCTCTCECRCRYSIRKCTYSKDRLPVFSMGVSYEISAGCLLKRINWVECLWCVHHDTSKYPAQLSGSEVHHCVAPHKNQIIIILLDLWHVFSENCTLLVWLYCQREERGRSELSVCPRTSQALMKFAAFKEHARYYFSIRDCSNDYGYADLTFFSSRQCYSIA